MKQYLTLIFFLLLTGTFVEAQVNTNFEPSDSIFATFPIPVDKPERLFYIQRDKNADTVVYDALLSTEGQLDSKKPIDVYWIQYTKDQSRNELNFIQRTIGYGVKTKVQNDGSYLVQFAASDRKTFTVQQDDTGKIYAKTTINDIPAKLEKIYVKAKETSWLPKVEYVDIYGWAIDTGNLVKERLLP